MMIETRHILMFGVAFFSHRAISGAQHIPNEALLDRYILAMCKLRA
jgi:hypothetical protein